ncbi:MAG: Wzz/FepE/Etk N-terminal domain-containing protein, partial [Gemmataceae bacterium]
MNTSLEDRVSLGNEQANADSTQRNLLLVLWDRKWLVILGLLVGSGIGALVYSRTTPIYSSFLDVLIIKKRSDVVNTQVGSAQAGDPMSSYLEDFVLTHIVLIKSPTIIERTIKTGKLNDLKTFESEDPRLILSRDLDAVRDDKATKSIIRLTFKSPYPEDVPIVLNAIINSYEDFLKETYNTVSGETVGLILKASDSLKKDLSKKEEEYRLFRENAPIILRGKDGASLSQSRMVDLESRRAAMALR